MVQLIGCLLGGVADAARLALDCVTVVNISHTAMGPVGAAGPPMSFMADGTPIATARAMRFYPDERLPYARTPARVRRAVAQRSLNLCYVAPLLFLPGGARYRVTELICQSARLTDHDAAALALILGETTCCLERVDMSRNLVTDKGADRIRKALKRNTLVVSFVLSGNPAITDLERVMEEIEVLLARNRNEASKRMLTHRKN
ncbi:hypothetical protein STCU_02541 [Strigomonas culicis]|uniref:Uncharacterized protein n=1 Tax=Strigomonas culicis TaxID=28005 RepID=S9WAI3_9TRYP|nr:hypothetical protein STCU_02541 [Strigomonas culicis]|eukprot:EPY32995.1 hypothetical protein STCU_02541 [Strigomonas culicis]